MNIKEKIAMVLKWLRNDKAREKDSGDVAQATPITAGVFKQHRFTLKKLKDINRKKTIILMILAVFVVGGATLVYISKSKNSKGPDNQSAIEKQEFVGAGSTIALQEHLLKSKDYQATKADYLIIGNEYKRQQNYAMAEKNYKIAESFEPDNIDVLYALADLYRLNKNKELSLGYYDRVIAAASNTSSSYHANLSIYELERKAVAAGKFEDIGTGGATDVPL